MSVIAYSVRSRRQRRRRRLPDPCRAIRRATEDLFRADRQHSRISRTSSRALARLRHAHARTSSRDAVEHPAPTIRWRPLLTENVRSARSSSATATRPSSRTARIIGWSRRRTTRPTPSRSSIRPTSSIGSRRASSFPRASARAGPRKGRNVADFWAPEMAKVGGEYWLGLHRPPGDRTRWRSALRAAPAPTGPWIDNGAPLITGKPVNTTGLGYEGGQPHDERRSDRLPHVHRRRTATNYLFWKDDTNSIWPRPLAMLLRKHPELIGRAVRDRRGPPHRRLRRRDRSVGQRPAADGALLPHAAADRGRARQLDAGRDGLVEFGLARAILEAMTTPIRAQRIAEDGRSLVGEDRIVLSNDLDWEGHLIEGPFVTCQDGRYWLFYAGNDFSTPLLRHRRRGRRSSARALRQAGRAAAPLDPRMDRAGPRLGRARPRRQAAAVLPRLPSGHRRLQRLPRAADRRAEVQPRPRRSRGASLAALRTAPPPRDRRR